MKNKTSDKTDSNYIDEIEKNNKSQMHKSERGKFA